MAGQLSSSAGLVCAPRAAMASMMRFTHKSSKTLSGVSVRSRAPRQWCSAELCMHSCTIEWLEGSASLA